MFCLKDVKYELINQLKRKRLDRIEKILEIHVAYQSSLFGIDIILREAFERMPIGECSEFLRIIFRHCGQDIRRHVKALAIKKAVFYNDRDSLDTLREISGRRCVDQVVLEEQQKFRSRYPLLSALVRGDVAEVERLLAAGSSTRPYEGRTGFSRLFSDQDMHPVKAAAEFGHTRLWKHCSRVHRDTLGIFNFAARFGEALAEGAILQWLPNCSLQWEPSTSSITFYYVNALKAHQSFLEMCCL